MKRCTALCAFAAALLLASSATAQGKYFTYPMKVDKLPNGLTVVRVPFDSKGLIAYYTVVRVGSRNEVEPGKSGFAHFFEHVMFKGTKKYPEGTRDRLLASLGFDDNAYTSDDVTVYNDFGPSSALEQLIDVESDRFKNLEFSEQTFQTEAKAVLGEYHKSAASPELKMEEELLRTAFTTHTYRHTTIGFYEDIKAMPSAYAYSQEFFKRWYTPDNAVIVIVGDFDDAKTLAMVKQAYGDWTGKAATVPVPAEPKQTEARKVSVEWPTPTLPRHVLAYHTPNGSLTTPDVAIQNVLGAYLAGPTSPLFRDLVLERQLTESISAGTSDHRDPFLFEFAATLKDESHRAAVNEAWEKALAEVAAGKVDGKRVDDIKKNARYSLQMGFETAPDVANAVAYYAGVFGAPDGVEKKLQQLVAVKPSDLSAFAKNHLTEKNRTTLTLTAAGGAK